MYTKLHKNMIKESRHSDYESYGWNFIFFVEPRSQKRL